jgi:hypothetical protein
LRVLEEEEEEEKVADEEVAEEEEDGVKEEGSVSRPQASHNCNISSISEA